MVEYAPSTGSLALWIRHQDVDGQSAAAFTDGLTICYGNAFDALSLTEQVGLLAHEVLHVALRHPQRYLGLQALLGDVDLALFNCCADAIVNSALGHLSWMRLPANAVHLDQLLSAALSIDQPVDKSLLEWDVERLYRSIDDRRTTAAANRRGGRRGDDGDGNDAQSASRRDGGGRERAADARTVTRGDGDRAARVRALGARTAIDLRPGPATRGQPEQEAEQAREWAERLTRGHAGDGEYSMLRTLVADLPRSRIPWEQVLRAQLARGLAPKRSLSWSRPSRSWLANQGRRGEHRRMPWEPGYTSITAVPRLALIVDVSGSIEPALLARFRREIEAIARRSEAGIVLIVGDDRVREVRTFAPGHVELGTFGFNGGGGTDFTPLLEEADRHRPDFTVVLTDLDGPARVRPRWPVLWAVPESRRHAIAPFGRTLALV